MRIEKRKTKPIIRISAILLCICLAVQNVSLITFAAEAVEEQTEELYTGEFTTELSSESFTENPESTEKATEEQIEETVQEPISEKQEETEQESTKQEISDRETETIAQTSEHESDMTSEEASITKEENISEETTTDNESETESIADEDSRTEIDNFSGEAVSRIEWLRELIAAFELNLDKENYPDNYYSDIDAKSEYYHDIMVATGYGLIDVEAGEAFCPDDAATREYAAFSMNMRVGYVNESNSYTFSEAGEVAYADDIQAAINNGWMTLSGSDFLPNKALTTDVKDHMIKEAKEIYASRKIDPNHNNQFEFTDDVIVIPSNTIVELSAENEIIITDCPKELKQGDIFAVFDSGMPLAYRAENVNKSGNQTIVSIGDVDIEDAFETFDMEGIINTDLTSVFVEDDDETVQLNYIVGGSEKKQFKDGTKYENLEELGNKEVSAVQIVQEFDYNEVNGKKWFGETSGDYYESNPAYKFTITQTISNIDVNYRSNGISSVYLTVSGNISIDCSLNLDLLDAFMPELKVVKIHVTPLAVTLDLDAVVTLKGKAVFNYDGYFEIGVDFKHNRGFKLVSHLWGETFSTQIEAEATVGLRASINANYVFIKGSLYAQMGLKGGISMLDKDDNGEPKKCVTIYAYLYADYGWSVKILISLDRNKKWSNNYKIYTIDNSPFRIAHHYENGVGVDKCTRSKKSLTGSTVGPMWFYNTPSNSKYGYNGGSSGFDSDGNPFTIFEYSLNEDNEATITKYNGNVSALSIPAELDGYKVVGIGDGVFKGKTALRTVVIPDSVESIGNQAFSGCANLSSVQLPENEKFVTLSSRLFYECKKLKRVKIPNSIISIKDNVFNNCESLEDVNLPNKLNSISYQVFMNVPITKITIPKSLETASGYYNGANICGAFYNCSTLKEVNFEERVTKIPSRLFAGCNGIEKIVVPNTVTNVEERAFEDCINLEKIEIPDSVINIGDYVFKDCEKLDNIIIPDTVTKIGQGTYSGCTSLTTAKLPNKIVNIPEGMFQDCTSLITIDLPTTITAIKQNAFKNTGLTELTLPENITTIENASFDNCTNLATVNFNNNLKTIGNYAFRNNDALSEIMIPNNVATIGNYAFQDSDALTTVKISDSVTTIGQYIFEHCDALKDVKLGSGLTKIPLYAFNLCPELQKIVLPYRITTVDANAFTNCTKLTEVIIPRGTTTISASAFSYPDRLTIYGISGTYAETYANQIGATFVNREVNAEDITLGSTSLSMITGAKHTLVMNVTPNDFTDEVVWKSSDTSIVTVDNMGIITANAVGTATVRVAVGEKTASCTVTVVQPVTSISLNKSSLSLEAFEEYILTATVSPSDAADKSIVWASSDESVVSVTQGGKVCAVSKGSAVITATSKDGSGKYGSCNVTVVSEGQLCTQYSGLESDHNYANNTNKVWKYVYSGAKTLDITFDSRTNVDDGFDFIYIYDKENKEVKKATGTELADQIIRITGDTVKIKLVSDEAVTAWGFKVTKISDDGKVIDPSDEKPEETETSTEEGSTEESSSEETSTEENSTEENSTEEESSTEDSGETIKDGCYITGLKTKTYTGSAVKQDIKVYYNKHLLQEGADYTVSYKNNVHAGIASLTVRAKGNLTGTITKTYKIKPRDITDEDVIIEESVYSYDKKKHKKAPIISYQGKKLKEGKDYEVISYDEGDYTAIGTYTATIRGLGNFTGTYDNAKIIIADKNKNLSKAKIAKIPTQSYQNGTAVTLPEEQIKVTLKGKHLKNGIDYNVTYANNRNFGKATIVIKGIGEYAGTKKANFTIKRTLTRLSDDMVVNINAIRTVEIQKNGAIPKPKLVSEGSTLLEGRDYRLSYKNNKKMGIGTMIIKGKGNYTGQLKLPFNITTKALTSTNLTIRVPNVPYIGKRNKYQSKPIITDNDGGLLILNKDYTIEAYHMGNMLLDKTSNPQEGALITVTIKGKGNYTGIVEAVYELRGSRFSQAVIQIAPKSYTGNPVELNVSDIILATIKTGKHKTLLQYGIDYEIVDYKNNIKRNSNRCFQRERRICRRKNSKIQNNGGRNWKIKNL